MGVAIILVLVTALVGPFFVDWTIYRSTFEKYAEQALGHKVTVLGDADIRLLPSPAVTFTDVRVGEAEDPLLVVSRFQMRIELPPLLKGEVRVLDMELDRPHLTLSLDESGRLDWLTAKTSDGVLGELPAEDVAFERISIVDGAVSIIDARNGETHRFDNGNLLISARTLAGPFKIDGSTTYDGKPYSLRLATGRKLDDGSIRVKGQVTPSAWPINLSVDGTLSEENGVPGYEGNFSLASIQDEDRKDNAWQTDGAFSANVDGLKVPSFEFRYGPEDRVLGLDGSAELAYSGKRHFEIRGRSKQVDLDRIFGGGPQAPVSVDDASSRLIAALKAVPIPDMDGVIALDVPAIVVGGGLAQDVKLDLETTLGGWRVARLAGRMPGRTVIATQGDLGLQPDLTYRGSVSISSEQPGAFAAWWRQKGKGASTIQPISMEGRLSLVPDGAALDNLRLNLAGSQATGGLSYQKPRSGHAVFSLSLDADKLDIDQVETLAGLFERPDDGPKDLDVSLRVQAREVSVRGVDGKGLSLEAEYSQNGLRIDRLYAEDLAGAEVDVSGRIDDILSAPEGRLAGTLNATDLTGITAVLGSVLPDNALVGRLERASGHLVPAHFQADLKASAQDGVSQVDFKLSGDAGGAKTDFDMNFNGRVDAWHSAEIGLGLSLSGPSGDQILRQLGFAILPVGSLGAGEVHLTAIGRPKDGLDVSLSASAGNATLGVEGRVTLQKDKEPDYRLSVSASAPDIAPYALLFGRVLPVMAGDIDASLDFDVSGTGSKIEVSKLKGKVAGVTVDGNLAGDLEPVQGETNRRLKGSLTLSALDLRFLSEAILGTDQWFSAGDGSSLWPNGAFGAPLLTQTDLTLQLSTDRMTVDYTDTIGGAKAELRLTPTMLRLDGLSGTYANGKLDGTLAIRRSGAEGAVSGTIKLTGGSVRDLVWTHNDRPVASGSFDLFLEYQGSGRTISGIVSGLTGGGTFAVTDGELRGINPQAFPLVIRAVDAGLDLHDDKIREVFLNHMAAGSLGFDRIEGTVSLIGGRLSARNVVVDSSRADVFGSAEVNLNDWTLNGDFSVKVDPGENAVTGAEPQVGLVFSGPVEAPVRTVDISPFTAFLTLRAFEKEVQRVEKLQAEILERDRLLREMKRIKHERARREREAEEAAARAAEEAERAAAAAAAAAAGGEKDSPAPNGNAAGGGAAAPAKGGDTRLPQDQSRNDVTAAPEEKPRREAGTDPADFANRIRSVIGSQNAQGGGPMVLEPAGAAAPSGGQASGELPPLEPPQEIDDLIAREIGIPASELNRPPDPVINGGAN
ncbi:AsmA family protein [Labrenzia aggregata]|uniref:AsmA family protein n=1 Tax=Roseibium aggregatum TaxID=187304 RepID=A0A926P1S7_9HYPH|nr:AsmA family protein [Roseibium aggregatum]